MKTEKMHIAERAREFRGEALTNLHQFITLDDLHESYEELNKYSSAGIDGKDWFVYGMDRTNRFPKLLSELKQEYIKYTQYAGYIYQKIRILYGHLVFPP